MKPLVLLIDDNSEFRRLTKTILTSSYEVVEMENGLEAMAVLQTGFKPDIIVSDLVMPELDGASLVKQIRSSGAFANIPLIVLSSQDKSIEKVKLLKMGASDYLTKPYNPEELLVRIGKNLKETAA